MTYEVAQRRLAVALRSLGLAVSLALAAGAVWAASPAEDYQHKAQDHLAHGQLRAAIIELKNALQRDPGHVPSRLLLGEAYLRVNDAPGAEKEFDRAAQLGAEPSQWMPGLARALLMQGKYDALLERATPDESLPPSMRASLLALRGQALWAKGEHQQAIAEYEAADLLDPANVQVQLGRIVMLMQRREFQQALAIAAQAAADHPDNPEVQLAKAELHRQLKQLAEAESHFQRAVELAGNNPRGYVGLGLVHLAQGKPDAALQDVQALRKRFPEQPLASYIHALAAYQKQDLDTAAEQLQLVLRAAPQQMQAQLLYGIVNYAQGKYQLAEDYLSRIHGLLPDEPVVAKLLAATRMKLQQPQRAIEILQGAAAKHPDDAQLMALLGTAYMQAGDNSQGAEYLGRAVELAPDQALLRAQLAVGQLASGDTPSAIAELEQAVNLGQDLVQADVLLVMSHLKAGQTDKALEVGERLRQRMPDSPIPPNLLGLTHLAAKQFDQARAMFQTALAKDPDFLVADMNLARLALVEGKPDEAVRAYQQVLAKNPKHQGAMLGLAAIARQRGDGSEYARWVEAAHEADPAASPPILLYAELMLQQGEPLKALSLLDGLPAPLQEDPRALRMRGMALIQAGQFSNAIHSLERLTTQRPNWIEGWFQLGRAQAAAGNFAAARSSFKHALALEGAEQVPLLLLALGEVELQTQRWDGALEAARSLQARQPDGAAGYELAAAAWQGKGDLMAARQALVKALAAEPTSKRVITLARIEAAAGMGAEAVATLQDWVQRQPGDVAAHTMLGLLQQKRGETDAAIASYEQALAHGQPTPLVLNNLAWLYLEKQDAQAQTHARKAYELAPDRAEIVDTYGWVLFKLGQQARGLGLLQEALVLSPRNPEIGLHVAEALHASGRDAEARPLLERIRRDHAGSSWAAAAKALQAKLGS